MANLAAVQTNGDVTADETETVIDAQQIARFAVALPASARTGNTRFGAGCP